VKTSTSFISAADATTKAAADAVSANRPGLDGLRNRTRTLPLPQVGDTSPRPGRLVLTSVWASVLVLVGMVVAIRTFIAILLETGSDWLVPTVMSAGIGGTVCAVLAFATLHRKWLPWQLLSLASLLLGANLALVVTQL
jgi:hypothetical protein